ncbi:MAG: hypothetical protein HY423_06440 [Candidatus Lambdaproteobacteria bacterium]|nr:hypothetical protein [Candidatus Lambdaproteobacteria bacterium]
MKFATAVLVLFAGMAAQAVGLWHGGNALAAPQVPRLTLETVGGPYVIGEMPGRVQVLFFSFPG